MADPGLRFPPPRVSLEQQAGAIAAWARAGTTPPHATVGRLCYQENVILALS